jgi:hypothetical protein|tara:strand:- start:391 stop:567 length:177 start_codon:yes stop_codon:yes gene_type:complete
MVITRNSSRNWPGKTRNGYSPDPAALNYLKELCSPETVSAGGDRHYVFMPLWLEDIKT